MFAWPWAAIVTAPFYLNVLNTFLDLPAEAFPASLLYGSLKFVKIFNSTARAKLWLHLNCFLVV